MRGRLRRLGATFCQRGEIVNEWGLIRIGWIAFMLTKVNGIWSSTLARLVGRSFCELNMLVLIQLDFREHQEFVNVASPTSSLF